MQQRAIEVRHKNEKKRVYPRWQSLAIVRAGIGQKGSAE